MPQVREVIEDRWYENRAVDADKKPRSLNLGTVTFAPGQSRYVPGDLIAASRFTHRAFTAALANGNLSTMGNKVMDEPVKMFEDHAAVEEVVEESVPEGSEADKTLSKSDLKSMDKYQLETVANDMGLDDSGSKSKLISRIIEGLE